MEAPRGRFIDHRGVVHDNVEVAKVVPQERVQQCTLEQIVDLPVPQIVEEIVERPVMHLKGSNDKEDASGGEDAHGSVMPTEGSCDAAGSEGPHEPIMGPDFFNDTNNI